MDVKSCKALILAGGMGTRLRAMVADRPKPMAGIHGKPFLEYLVDFFRKQGVRQFIFSVGYKAELIQDYFKNGATWNVQIEYAFEKDQLGTGGALLNAQHLLSANTFVANGDTLVETELEKLLQFHHDQHADWTFVVQKSPKPIFDQVGSFVTSSTQQVIELGKANGTKTSSDWLNCGLYCINAQALSALHLSAPCSLEQQLIPELFAQQKKIFVFPTEGYFCDMGTPASLTSMLQDGIPTRLWQN